MSEFLLGYIPTEISRRSTLVSRGAILASLHKDIVGIRKLDFNVGFARNEDYDESLHPEPEDPRIHGALGKVVSDYWSPDICQVQNRVKWLFKKVSRSLESMSR